MTRRQRISYAIKFVVAHALFYVGLLQLWQRLVMRRRAIVLMYHRVLTAEEQRRTGSHPALVVDRATFARQMSLLKRRFVVLTAEEFVERLRTRNPFPDSSCLITFDDGWLDNYTNALPELQKRGLPALVFLPVNYVGTRRLFWQESLTHLLRRAIDEGRFDLERRERIQRILEPDGLADLVVGPSGVDILQAIASQKRLTRQTVEALQAALALELGVDLEDFAKDDGFIDWEQAAAMTRAGIAFGGHGAEHLLLTQVSTDEAKREIDISRSVVSQRLGRSCATFSYPNGYWKPALAREVRDAGYQAAFTTRRGFVSCDDDPFSVCRLNIHEGVTSTAPMFLARVVGLL